MRDRGSSCRCDGVVAEAKGRDAPSKETAEFNPNQNAGMGGGVGALQTRYRDAHLWAQRGYWNLQISCVPIHDEEASLKNRLLLTNLEPNGLGQVRNDCKRGLIMAGR